MGLAVCAMIIGSAALAVAGVPDLQNSHAEMAYLGTETLSLYVVPNGDGAAFNEAFAPGGSIADATVTITLVDALGVVVQNFPFQDMWLESNDGGMVPCGGNATADVNSDENGQSHWAAPLFAGGQSQDVCLVKISGDALTSNNGLLLNFNSADINADGIVNLSDGGYFTDILYGTYSYNGDFNNDGVVNVSDAGSMSNGIGASCP